MGFLFFWNWKVFLFLVRVEIIVVVGFLFCIIVSIELYYRLGEVFLSFVWVYFLILGVAFVGSRFVAVAIVF